MSTMLAVPSRTHYRIRATYYTPMTKPLGVNVPGSSTSTIPGSAPLMIETHVENPLTVLARKVTEETLSQLPVKVLRELVVGIQALSTEKLSKSGKKIDLIKRIVTSRYKEAAVQQFLIGKNIQESRKPERLILKLFNSLRGALRQAGMEIMRDLHLPYSIPGLSDDSLPEGAHRPGECLDSDQTCLICRVFGSLNQPSLFKNYTPPLVDDPDHKLNILQELNHVLIRTHSRNVHRPNGSTLNFNQQYFAGTFVTYLWFPVGLPDPVILGFLFNCLEHCDNVGAAKAWGAGKLFLQSYTLEKVEVTYVREWTGDALQMSPQIMVTPLKAELDQAFSAYTRWLTQVHPTPGMGKEGEVVV